MHVDVTRELAAVTREVGTRTRDGKTARAVIARRTYAVEVDALWDALTNRERIPRWFLPVSGALEAGGHFSLEGNASGDITACEPPTRFALTWKLGDDVSRVEVKLHGDGKHTRLELEHVALVPDERWAQLGPGGLGVGWEQALLGLSLHVEANASVPPDVAAAWPKSENGRQFTQGASDAWAEAAVKAGDDTVQAHQAASRVTARYTGG